jgi:hypothetical protein
MNTTSIANASASALAQKISMLTPAQIQEVSSFIETLMQNNVASKSVVQLAGIWSHPAWAAMDIEAELREARREMGTGVLAKFENNYVL